MERRTQRHFVLFKPRYRKNRRFEPGLPSEFVSSSAPRSQKRGVEPKGTSFRSGRRYLEKRRFEPEPPAEFVSSPAPRPQKRRDEPKGTSLRSRRRHRENDGSNPARRPSSFRRRRLVHKNGGTNPRPVRFARAAGTSKTTGRTRPTGRVRFVTGAPLAKMHGRTRPLATPSLHPGSRGLSAPSGSRAAPWPSPPRLSRRGSP